MLIWNYVIGRIAVIFGAAAMALCLVPLAMVGHWAVADVTSMALTIAYGISIAGILLGSGWLIETSGYPALFGGSTLITLLGVLCFHIYFRTPRGEYANSPPE